MDHALRTAPLLALALAASLPVAAKAAPAVAAATASTTACTESTAPAGPDTIDGSSTATFGPLSLTPALSITPADGYGVGEMWSVPGGILLSAGHPDDPSAPGALSFVEHGGALRWKRCSETMVHVSAAAADSGQTTALIDVSGEYDEATGTTPVTTKAIDLRTAEEVAAPKPLATAAAGPLLRYFDTSEYVLYGSPRAASRADPERDFLVLVDLSTMAAKRYDVPDEAATAEFGSYRIGDEGVIGFSSASDGRIDAALVEADWTTDAAPIDAAFPVRQDLETAGIGAPLKFVRPSGAPAWTLPSLIEPGSEGFRYTDAGDGVTLVAGCSQFDKPQCDQYTMVGIETDDGTELWRNDTFGTVFAAGEGKALMGGTGPDQLIDARSGQPAAGQEWTGAFHTGCCGDPAYTESSGGVVVTTDGTTAWVYLPAGVGGPTVEVTA